MVIRNYCPVCGGKTVMIMDLRHRPMCHLCGYFFSDRIKKVRGFYKKKGAENGEN